MDSIPRNMNASDNTIARTGLCMNFLNMMLVFRLLRVKHQVGHDVLGRLFLNSDLLILANLSQTFEE